MRCDGGVPGEGELLVYQSFIPGMHYAINDYQLRLNVQRFHSPVNFIALYYNTQVLYLTSWGCKSYIAQVLYLGCNDIHYVHCIMHVIATL